VGSTVFICPRCAPTRISFQRIAPVQTLAPGTRSSARAVRRVGRPSAGRPQAAQPEAVTGRDRRAGGCLRGRHAHRPSQHPVRDAPTDGALSSEAARNRAALQHPPPRHRTDRRGRGALRRRVIYCPARSAVRGQPRHDPTQSASAGGQAVSAGGSSVDVDESLCGRSPWRRISPTDLHQECLSQLAVIRLGPGDGPGSEATSPADTGARSGELHSPEMGGDQQ
jgi:hypothetical protein